MKSTGGCRYNCSAAPDGTVAKCWACPAIPAGAHWLPFGDPAFAPCAARCDPGLYGSAVAGGGQCLRCSLYVQSAAAAGLYPPPPALGGLWNDTDGRCDADSWACAAGFQRSPTGARYCCPLVIQHSTPAVTAVASGAGACGVVCEAGFWWDNSTASCAACTGLPSTSTWVLPASQVTTGYLCSSS